MSLEHTSIYLYLIIPLNISAKELSIGSHKHISVPHRPSKTSHRLTSRLHDTNLTQGRSPEPNSSLACQSHGGYTTTPFLPCSHTGPKVCVTTPAKLSQSEVSSFIAGYIQLQSTLIFIFQSYISSKSYLRSSAGIPKIASDLKVILRGIYKKDVCRGKICAGGEFLGSRSTAAAELGEGVGVDVLVEVAEGGAGDRGRGVGGRPLQHIVLAVEEIGRVVHIPLHGGEAIQGLELCGCVLPATHVEHLDPAHPL